MNWKRIGYYCLFYILASIASGIPFGYLFSADETVVGNMSKSVVYSQWVVSFFVGLVVFVSLACKQIYRPIAHAAIVAGLVAGGAVITEVAILGTVIYSKIAIDGVLLLMSLIFGVVIGICLQRNSAIVKNA